MMKRMRKLRAVRNPKSNYEPNSSTNNQSTEGRHSPAWGHPRLELQLTYLTVARNQIRTRGSSITTGGNKDTYGFCIQHS